MQGFVNLTTNEMENAWRYDYLQRERELKPTTGKFLASHLHSQDPTVFLVSPRNVMPSETIGGVLG